MERKHTPQSTLIIEDVVPEDIPKLSDVWFGAFNSPSNQELFPDTPGVHTWWDEANREDLLHKPYQKYLKVIDSTHPENIVAYGKWDLEPDECVKRYPPWHTESNAKLCNRFFGGIEKQRKRLMGKRKHYYLDMLATNPEYRRRGAASMLVRWGCELADRNGATIYIASSKEGVPLYQRCGFVLLEGLDDTPEGISPMIREPNPKG
ncbi:hypothetical protein BBP40_012397 [Aspergillus hancockii]|nr:hypothetical protein BBP40_012397 [Aspergillus hancockii]